ncbi:unnamed protein product (macronuclear) [Paramecium tetraurelia]|uniref:Chromosome undetermined scaffold_108, whole genome shotgun sequence n=1 Tax=Paramecium tetraurelia TaxID=5888 RepID=A0BHJ0_PARTE|nr:uncharacterized protein GSPATT00029042001 [Paramecium tetraurelia]XP_001440282.1 uncharacterized protein GSPATT00038842001 [Paramecium tetraurelia]CAK58007.1 unnamed protein product [Paramecium tetraurelia]CAK72885.1 unnamed protein product [Paramecium tetraurelia]|eukprot:XP_001425405.1 hypothetical protein (macronuclear) [Paramecium tetraurelia strain d4-2]
MIINVSNNNQILISQIQMASKLSVKCNIDHNNSFHNQKKPIQFENPIRRKSCYCKLCGNLSLFQQQNSNLPTQKEIQFSKQKRIKRRLSFGDEIQTDFPNKLSQNESENGRRIRQNNKSISLPIKWQQGFSKNNCICQESSIKTKRKSCECSECGKLNPFKIKSQEILFKRQQ